MAPTPALDIEPPAVRAERESTAAASVGGSNTRHSDKFDAPRIVEAGIDTLRLLYRCDRFGGRPLGPLVDESTGEVVATVQWFGSHSLAAVEGHPKPGALGHFEDVQRCVFEWADLLKSQRSAIVSGMAGVSRLDATATTRFDHPGQGVALLQGMASIDWPRLKPVVYGKPPETVALTYRNSKGRILARAYDTGLLRGTAERGQLVRLEDQGRFPSGRRPIDATSQRFARSRFQSRFRPLWQASKGVTVASLPVLTDRVACLVDTGEMKPSQAERLVGFLALDTTTRSRFNVRTTQRRRRELRDLGLVLADGFFEPVEIDLAAVLEAALDSPAWGHG
jgi:hypothetical protein